MIVEAGHFALALAVVLAALQSALPILGARRNDAGLMAAGGAAALSGFAMVGLSFLALVHAYVASDFSVRNVYENSHSLMPLVYKVSGTWGNHEGSMLLWCLVLALCGALVAASRGLPARLKADVLGVQGLIALAFLAFVLLASNPFERLPRAPFEGRDLNPVLQDLGLAVHPPLLYLGYVGYSVAFAFAAAALIQGKADSDWARHARPWMLGAWVFLTLGIAMGSYWAYYELGWGGWWFWDPVENASLMPWIAGTALLHSVVVTQKRGGLTAWTLLLAVVAFSLSLLGTFLVRSGVLTSVHSFASDPTRGLFILVILVAFIGGALALYAWRAPTIAPGGLFAPVSREGAIVLNNLILSALAFAVLVGTLYPLGLEAVTGDKISVGPPYYVAVTLPLALPLLLAIPLGGRLAWKRGDLLGAAQRVGAALALGLGVALVVGAWKGGPWLAPLGLGLGAYLVVGSLAELVERAGRGGVGGFARRLIGLPLAAHGAALAHAGVGVMAIGVAAQAYEVERAANLRPGERLEIAGYELVLAEVTPRVGPNYRDLTARFEVREGGRVIAQAVPAKRVYAAGRRPTTEAALVTRGLSQLYLALGDATEPGVVPVRAYWKPLILPIWLGAVAMALGGALCLADRRRRVRAPAARAVPAGRPA